MRGLLRKHSYPAIVSKSKNGKRNETILLKFGSFISEVVERNIEAIVNYGKSRKASIDGTGPHVSDFKVPPFEVSNTVKLLFHVVINTDGVNIVKSKTTKEFYPVWISLVELPPRLRQSYRNTVLAALFCGDDKPDWDLVFDHLRKEISGGIVFNYHAQYYNADIKPVVLVVDMIAKASVLNFIQCNGYYGCNLCTDPGVRVERVQTFPFGTPATIRSPRDHKAIVDRAKTMPTTTKYCKGRLHPSLLGVKGPSVLGEYVCFLFHL